MIPVLIKMKSLKSPLCITNPLCRESFNQWGFIHVLHSKFPEPQFQFFSSGQLQKKSPWPNKKNNRNKVQNISVYSGFKVNIDICCLRMLSKPLEETLLWEFVFISYIHFNTLRLRQNGCHFPDNIFKCIFLNENVWILLRISLKFLLKFQINNIPAMVQIMAWCRPGNKPLSEPIMVSLLMHICAIRLQCVNNINHQIALLKSSTPGGKQHETLIGVWGIDLYLYGTWTWSLLCLRVLGHQQGQCYNSLAVNG